MHQIEILTQQTEDAYGWANKLINSISYDLWEETPAIVESNVSWQVGHLIMSFYFHSIATIVGRSTDIAKEIPLKEYAQLFTNASPQEGIIGKTNPSPRRAIGKTNPKELYRQLIWIEQKSIAVIESLSAEELASPLEPTRVPHPIATNKWEALDWNIKHTMWHCGQLSMLKRIVDERFDFGLKLS